MAYEIPNFTVGEFPADVDMSTEATYQYSAVCVVTAASVTGAGVGGAAIVPPGSVTSPIIGVLQNNPAQAEAGQVMIQGVTKALAGGTFQIGDLLMVNSSGQFLKATSGNFAVAQALEKAVSGDITTVLLVRNGKQ